MCLVNPKMHELTVRVYKATTGSKASSNAVSTARLPPTAKLSRAPFAGSEVSLQLLPTGEQPNTPCQNTHAL